MARIPLTLACGAYDRTAGLRDGSVTIEGVDLNYIVLGPEEIFYRMLRHQEFDVAEMSLSSYVLSLFLEEPPFVAVPVFPSRSFRHDAIYVNRSSGIGDPADLVGRVVGVPEYQMTAAVWARGMLADDYGVDAASLHHRTGGLHEPGRVEKLPLHLPAAFDVAPISPGATLSAMLADGELDALISARRPRCFDEGKERVSWLFDRPIEVEQEYFARSRIFPIMHTLVIRKPVHDRHPWLAQALLKAFTHARDEALMALYDAAASATMLPWGTHQFQEARALMGEDLWAYGLAANEHVLSTFLRYSFEQGLIPKELAPGDLFAGATYDRFAI